MSELQNSGKLFARIAQVMGKVRSLPKDGYNKQNAYNYVSSDTALDAIGRAMAEFGVVVIPSMVHYDTVTDGKMTRAKAEFDMHICGAEGDVFTSRWTSEGIDYGNPDKALTKAITYATKTFLLKLFVVGAGGEDPDSESAPDEKPVQRTQPQQATAQRQQPATNGAQHRNGAQQPQPGAENAELAASVNAVIVKPDPALEKARKAFHAELQSTFAAETAEDITHARHWLIKRYTTKTTPDNVRESANDLAAAELTALAGVLKTHRKTYQDQWIAEKTAPIPANKLPLVAA